MIWNPGDDTDLNEGGTETDTVEVNGGNGAEQFTTTANGTRVRFDRINPAPFSIDIGTSEKLTVNANGGDDSYSATGNLAALIGITVDGGTGNDNLLGSNGNDILLGGDGNDFADGQQGNDTAFMGAGDDTFQWDPGDGSDIIEGQDGADKMTFNGSNISERMDVSANGGRVRFTRDVAAITMDLNDVESIVVKALGGADTLTVNDVSGTDLTNVSADLGGDDAAADNVITNATNGDDVVTVSGTGPSAQVNGLPALVSVTGAIAGSDRVTVNALAGDDVVDASGLAADSALLTADGGDGSDVLIGGAGDGHAARRRGRRRPDRRPRGRHPRRRHRRQRRDQQPHGRLRAVVERGVAALDRRAHAHQHRRQDGDHGGGREARAPARDAVPLAPLPAGARTAPVLAPAVRVRAWRALSSARTVRRSCASTWSRRTSTTSTPRSGRSGTRATSSSPPATSTTARRRSAPTSPRAGARSPTSATSSSRCTTPTTR